MLVLSRQKDESIMIGDEVEITIVDVRGDKVRLGITAPKSIPVHRREIYDAIQREKAQKEGEVRAGDNGSADKSEDAGHQKTDKPEKASQK
jgi:carbon storage regulator